MPRFFAQAQQQAMADRRKAFTLADAMKKEQQSSFATSGVQNGLQGALAQMESNAAAAMARFNKSFRPGPPQQKEESEPTPSVRSDEAPESPIMDPRSDSAPPEALSEPMLARSSKFLALELAARRCISAADRNGTPWHHELRGTPWEWLSGLLDQPVTLLAVAAACLTFGCWAWLWPLFRSLFTVQRLSTLVGVSCLLLAVSGWLLRTAAFMHAQMSAFADTVPRMPRACEEMSEMLIEMKLMRVDLKSMKAKVAWLPGGE